ncbi:alkaline phosphatase [Alkalicoccus daliensis]|uniref:Alkaline phosphatase n=1 Tax=Alkalicoccus daliensis TaxID=745820 RepID=A0A1H0E5V2_9BACI|nr:alkaline phosphatase [Alkalicoccus daliensis]SDN77683.1 alkaline phosphatase [Alkalicoccus daliensis]
MFKKATAAILSVAVIGVGLGFSNGDVHAGPPGHAGKPDQPGPPAHAGKPDHAGSPGHKKSKENIENVIYFIPDGYSAGYNVNYRHYKEDGAPVWDDFLTGMITTHSNNNRVTDSAAAGTAMATGTKTNNGMIGQTPDGEELETILEAASKAGKSTGLVANSTITHATPAAFASHVDSRNNQEEIARQYIDQGVVDVFLGGGLEYFLPESEGGRQEERHLLNEAIDMGYQFVENQEELLNIEEGNILGLFADGAMAPELHREETDQPSIAEMTSSAIDVLDQNEEGFFLMVEGSQIDWAGHANDAAWAMSDTAAFEEAVIDALDFADQDGETLIVIAGDHDTGGMTLGGYESKGSNVEILHNVTATGDYMAAQLNDDRSNVAEVVEEYAAITLTEEEAQTIQQSNNAGLAINQTISNYAGVGWSTTSHTGIEVPIYAYGLGSEQFSGLLDNTDLPKAMTDLLQLPALNE